MQKYGFSQETKAKMQLMAAALIGAAGGPIGIGTYTNANGVLIGPRYIKN